MSLTADFEKAKRDTKLYQRGRSRHVPVIHPDTGWYRLHNLAGQPTGKMSFVRFMGAGEGFAVYVDGILQPQGHAYELLFAIKEGLMRSLCDEAVAEAHLTEMEVMSC
jgi:hypothetical protein